MILCHSLIFKSCFYKFSPRVLGCCLKNPGALVSGFGLACDLGRFLETWFVYCGDLFFETSGNQIVNNSEYDPNIWESTSYFLESPINFYSQFFGNFPLGIKKYWMIKLGSTQWALWATSFPTMIRWFTKTKNMSKGEPWWTTIELVWEMLWGL